MLVDVDGRWMDGWLVGCVVPTMFNSTVCQKKRGSKSSGWIHCLFILHFFSGHSFPARTLDAFSALSSTDLHAWMFALEYNRILIYALLIYYPFYYWATSKLFQRHLNVGLHVLEQILLEAWDDGIFVAWYRTKCCYKKECCGQSCCIMYLMLCMLM